MTTTATPTSPAPAPASDRFGDTRSSKLLGRVAAASVAVLVAAALTIWLMPPVVLFVAAFAYVIGVPVSYPLEAVARRRPAGMAPTAVYALVGAMLGAPLGAWLGGGSPYLGDIAALSLMTGACGMVAATLASSVGPRIRGRWRWVVAVAGLLMVPAAAAAFDALSEPGPPPSPAPAASAYELSILERPLAATDGLPPAARTSPHANLLADPDHVRLARRSHGLVLYVGVGADGRACLVEHPEEAPEELQVACALYLHDEPLVLEYVTLAEDHPRQGSEALVRMLIIDGHDTYDHHWGRAGVVNNVAVLAD